MSKEIDDIDLPIFLHFNESNMLNVIKEFEGSNLKVGIDRERGLIKIFNPNNKEKK